MNYRYLILLLISIQCFAQKPTLYTIGDSTMADKIKPDENPEKGWCQVLPSFFDLNKITIDNRAVNGRSTRSFINEKRWESVYKSLKKEIMYLFNLVITMKK